MKSVESIVKQIIADQLSYGLEIKNSDHLMKDLGADSLDVVEIEMKIEKECSVRIDCINYGFEDPTVQYYIDEVNKNLGA